MDNARITKDKMAKKEKGEELHKDKTRKKRKNHKSSKIKTLETAPLTQSPNFQQVVEEEFGEQEVVEEQVVEEEVVVDGDYPSRMPSTEIDINESIIYNEEIVDIEVEEVTLDYSMESSRMEEESVDQVIETIEKVKKPNKKNELLQTPLNKASSSTAASSNAKKSKKRRESGTSSEEERWLTAIESGKLEDVEDVELRKIKDPKLMTARQRAMYDRNNETESAPGFTEALIALPTGYKEKEKPQTAEEIQKAALKILRRKQQADEKREKDKKKTMDRLLKKQESKNRSSAKPKTAKEAIPVISYRNTAEGSFLNLPLGMEFPLQPQTPKEPPPKQLCGIQGCGQPKVYNCSKTNMPLCSFACYRKNVQSLKNIIC
ncbi:INO80 complex subunit B [Stomoxys calcitrans]|uniref:INO80 complex subunit B-like conserved region domain-containing protein n=1 Tax=Stomoxys calcitrans TaxID=35570 RepID=A0A1I8PM38_STOCA|nr:INO80 complex subunit B [Stomoxys calcitrans]